MTQIIENFQFIRPLYLLAFIALFIGYFLTLVYAKNHNLWQQIIPAHLYNKMVISKGIRRSNHFIHAALLGMALGIIAVAGPSWEKLPQAVYQTQAGKVILMDMSLSMRATDLSPNRLTRARFKAIDLLNEVSEGETGLVAYAGDAFVVSPLTDDAINLKTLIPVLAPEIMPTQGSSAFNGLNRASELLANAGYQSGQIYWITDGIHYDEITEVRDFIKQSKYDISALLVGTEQGAPVQLEDGQLLKERNGNIVVPSINSRYMDQAMLGTGASYELFANDNSDIQTIKRKVSFEQQEQAQAVENTTGDKLKDAGPYLVLLILPLAAYAFRKGVVTVLLLTSLAGTYVLSPSPAFAQSTDNIGNNETSQPEALSNSSEQAEPTLDKIFKNPDQRAKLAFDSENYEKANQLFENKAWKAASAYKLGDYEAAVTLYDELSGIQNTYNKGNALAKQGKLQEALDAYNEVLRENSEHANAAQNKMIVEQMLEQQQQQEQQQEQEQQDDDSQQDQESEQDQKNNQQENSEQQESSSEDDGEQEQSDSQSNESENERSEQEEQNQSQQQSDSDESQDSQQQGQQESSENEDALQKAANEQSEQDNSEQNNREQTEKEQAQANEQQTEQQTEQQENNTQAEQQAAISNQHDMSELSPEQQEEMQRMQMILNKVPDDPAFLLKRKMLLEAYKRKGTPPPPSKENW